MNGTSIPVGNDDDNIVGDPIADVPAEDVVDEVAV